MKRFYLSLLVVVLTLCFTGPAYSAVYLVSKTADTNDGMCDADCSLREAVTAAGATVDADFILFALPLFASPQMITLSGTDIIISSGGGSPLQILGPGANRLTISGNNASRIFTNNTGAITNITGVRLTGGNGVSSIQTGRAGAVYNNGGNLTLVQVVISGNSAANGGGLNNAGTATFNLVESIVSGNSATGAGGGMQNFSGNTMNIVNSTISGNTCNSTLTGGGAIQANGNLVITNSTFSGNNAVGGDGGAIYFNGTSMTMTNTTIARNTSTSGSGGFHKTTTNPANIRNTIFAGNSIADAQGAFNSLGNNIIQLVGTSTGWVGSDLQNTDPLLGPLAFYGGFGMTHGLLAGSPAINAGASCVIDLTCTSNNPTFFLNQDQRGAPRLLGSPVDIGAFEVYSAYTATLPSAIAGQAYSFVIVPNLGAFTHDIVDGSFGSMSLSVGPPALTLSGTEPTPVIRRASLRFMSGAGSVITRYRLDVLPDLATVPIEGRVLRADGTPVPKALVTLVDLIGNAVTARTNGFGWFRFSNVTAGRVFLLDVGAKGSQFPRRTVVTSDALELTISAVAMGPSARGDEEPPAERPHPSEIASEEEGIS